MQETQNVPLNLYLNLFFSCLYHCIRAASIMAFLNLILSLNYIQEFHALKVTMAHKAQEMDYFISLLTRRHISGFVVVKSVEHFGIIMSVSRPPLALQWMKIPLDI